MIKLILIVIAGVVLSACDQQTPEDPKTRWTDGAATAWAPVKQRWYTPEQVTAGAALYRENCSTCHKENAEGTADWKTRDANGQLPPPPLNGTAHTWHHPLRALAWQIKFGAPGGQGAMPGFSQTLSDEQVSDVVAWFQDRWSDEIYAQWFEIEMRSRAK